MSPKLDPFDAGIMHDGMHDGTPWQITEIRQARRADLATIRNPYSIDRSS